MKSRCPNRDKTARSRGSSLCSGEDFQYSIWSVYIIEFLLSSGEGLGALASFVFNQPGTQAYCADDVGPTSNMGPLPAYHHEFTICLGYLVGRILRPCIRRSLLESLSRESREVGK
jgi:hypothetical protein